MMATRLLRSFTLCRLLTASSRPPAHGRLTACARVLLAAGLGTTVMTAKDAMEKREAAKEEREERMKEYIKEAIEAESFEDLSDEEALRSMQKEEL